MSTGQTRTYPLKGQRKRPPDVCLHLSLWLRYTLLFSVLSFPGHPAHVSAWKRYPFHGSLRFWWLAAIVEPFLLYFSNDSLQRHLKDTSRKAWWWQRLELSRLLWGGWLISTLLVLCSQKALAFHGAGHLPHEVQQPIMSTGQTRTYPLWQRKSAPDVCLYSLLYQLPTTRPVLFSYTLWDFSVAFQTAKLLSVIDDFPLCKGREAWWICKYRRLFREQVNEWTSCRNSLPFHQLTSLVLGTKKSL